MAVAAVEEEEAVAVAAAPNATAPPIECRHFRGLHFGSTFTLLNGVGFRHLGK